mmetsp:Transcript_64049/g.169664  ORF Transcript_64049/g.169664 Transcript_64049/m.169664 type:complete len:219 (+) Transcript_64049:1494-2150(+)
MVLSVCSCAASMEVQLASTPCDQASAVPAMLRPTSQFLSLVGCSWSCVSVVSAVTLSRQALTHEEPEEKSLPKFSSSARTVDMIAFMTRSRPCFCSTPTLARALRVDSSSSFVLWSTPRILSISASNVSLCFPSMLTIACSEERWSRNAVTCVTMASRTSAMLVTAKVVAASRSRPPAADLAHTSALALPAFCSAIAPFKVDLNPSNTARPESQAFVK